MSGSPENFPAHCNLMSHSQLSCSLAFLRENHAVQKNVPSFRILTFHSVHIPSFSFLVRCRLGKRVPSFCLPGNCAAAQQNDANQIWQTIMILGGNSSRMLSRAKWRKALLLLVNAAGLHEKKFVVSNKQEASSQLQRSLQASELVS